ncbi:MAG: nucleotide exchange factor GrpE [Gemmataceae bacterium]|nr:nucleotide exchange factor GrpE [Gemmataceae bacterium]
MSDQNRQPDAPNATQQPPDGPSTPTAEELAALRTRAAERDQFLDLLQRTRADFENYQKRNQRDREQERRYMQGEFVLKLLPIYDNLRRAIAEARRVGETGPLVQGVNMVLTQFLDLLRVHGVTPIQAQGQPFDPAVHEAIAQQPAPPGTVPNTVLHVVEEGFLNQDRVLRPAKVVVTQG